MKPCSPPRPIWRVWRDSYFWTFPNYLVGAVVAFLVAYASIAWLLRFVAHHSIAWFVPYRVALGTAILVLLATGVMTAT